MLLLDTGAICQPAAPPAPQCKQLLDIGRARLLEAQGYHVWYGQFTTVTTENMLLMAWYPPHVVA